MTVLSGHPPLGFFSTVALVLPVLFLAAMVELRLSATAPSMEAESADDLAMRIVAFLLALVGVTVGEAACLVALWNGQGSSTEAGWALYGILVLAVMLILPLVSRLRVELRAGERERSAAAMKLAIQLISVMVVGAGVTMLVTRL